MKNKTHFFIVILLLSFFSMKGQEGNSIVNAYLGIGGSKQGAEVKTPAFYGSYEYFVMSNITVGGLIGYSTLSDGGNEYLPDGGEENTQGNFILSGLAHYYFVQNESLDVYTGIKIGYASGLIAGLLYEFNFGGRYHINDNISIASELGFGTSLLKVGVSFQL
jgi:hypothetical protein